MLKQPTCAVLECHNILNSFNEVTKGICHQCINLMTDSNHYVGVCWNCDTIIGIYEIPRRLERILTEKYLFAKKCHNCSHDIGNYLEWITVKKYSHPFHWAIGKDGKLIKTIKRTDTSSPSESSKGYSTRHALDKSSKPPQEKLFDNKRA